MPCSCHEHTHRPQQDTAAHGRPASSGPQEVCSQLPSSLQAQGTQPPRGSFSEAGRSHDEAASSHGEAPQPQQGQSSQPFQFLKRSSLRRSVNGQPLSPTASSHSQPFRNPFQAQTPGEHLQLQAAPTLGPALPQPEGSGLSSGLSSAEASFPGAEASFAFQQSLPRIRTQNIPKTPDHPAQHR